MRICIVAENASTVIGGEAIIPIHYFRLLRSNGVEAWLVVHARSRSELTKLFPQDLDSILFVPDLWIHKLLFRLSHYLPRRLFEGTFGLFNQIITQFFQRTIVRQLVRDKQIDVIHQPIPVAPRFPSVLFGLDAPVVIGPLNGGMEFPQAFRHNESWMNRFAISAIRLSVDVANAFLPGKRRANVVLVANGRTRLALPSGIRGKVIELAENGVDLNLWNDQFCDSEEEAPRFVFLGRMVDWKAVDVVIRALAQVPAARLELIGDGPMLETWRKLADELGLKERVYFTGSLPQIECPARLRSCVALVLPSVYECGGAVVLEAMAMGKPVIASDWGGPADYLDDSCGVLVEPESYSGLVAGFAAAMQKLIDSPALAKSMGAAGRERAIRDFDWQRKIDEVIGIYHALAEKSDVTQGFDESRVFPATASERQ
jgi:glycosyltransferase involved in cell wall biosynthesis